MSFKRLNNCILGVAIFGASTMAFACEEAKTLVGVLKAKQHLVEMYSSEAGPLYTVKTPEGRSLAEYLTDSEVLSQFPDLKSIIHGIADDASLGPDMSQNSLFDEIKLN